MLPRMHCASLYWCRWGLLSVESDDRADRSKLVDRRFPFPRLHRCLISRPMLSQTSLTVKGRDGSEPTPPVFPSDLDP